MYDRYGRFNLFKPFYQVKTAIHVAFPYHIRQVFQITSETYGPLIAYGGEANSIFCLTHIRLDYYTLPINNYLAKEIQKANYFLIHEKMYLENKKKKSNKTPSNYNNVSILIRNNSNKSDNSIINNKKEKKFIFCSNENNLDIIYLTCDGYNF